LLLTGGQIQPNSEGIFTFALIEKLFFEVNFLNYFLFFVEAFEVACKIHQDIVMHPFAFRTHAHKLGKIFFQNKFSMKKKNLFFFRFG